MGGFRERKIARLVGAWGHVPSEHTFVYAGCHPAGRRFLLGKFFAEQVSWCGIDPLKSVLSGWPDGFMAGRVVQAVSVPVQNDPAA